MRIRLTATTLLLVCACDTGPSTTEDTQETNGEADDTNGELGSRPGEDTGESEDGFSSTGEPVPDFDHQGEPYELAGPPLAYDGNVWLDACEFQDPAFQHLLKAEAMLVPQAFFHDNLDGTFKILASPFVDHYEPLQVTTYPLDPDSLFYGQLRSAFGRSGVLVGPDIVATAPHVTNFDFANFRVVFGLASKTLDGVCVQPNWDQVPAENIYDPVEMIANSWENVPHPHDYVFLRLDRQTDRQPLRIRRSGRADIGDRLLSVGHPKQLSTKISPEGEALGWDEQKGLLMNGLHHLSGSSGSMIYNSDADYIEALVSTGVCGGMALNQQDSTMLVLPSCSTTPRTTNRPIADIADLVPAFSLVVKPLGKVLHQAPLNGLPTALHTQYELRAPSEAAAPIHWQILLPPVIAGQPNLTINTPSAGLLQPGQSLPVKATAGSSGKCGVYERTLQVNDLTNGYTDYIPHRFEVGMRQFTTEPADGFHTEKMGGPFDQAVKIYKLSNPSPTPVKVLVAGPGWVDLKVQQGGGTISYQNKVVVSLPGNTSKNSSAKIHVSIDDAKAAAMMPHYEYKDELKFSIDFSPGYPSCYVASNTSRPLSFIRGKQSFEQFTEGEFIPKPENPFVSELKITELFTVDWISVDVGLWSLDNFPEYQFANLQLTLVSPQGTELKIWDLNDIPHDDYYSDEITTHFGYDLPIGVLHLDDALTPSPLGTELNVLQDTQALGTWKLKVSSPSIGAIFVNWRLHFFGTPSELVDEFEPPPIPIDPVDPPMFDK